MGKTRCILMILVILFALSAVACGGDDGESKTSSRDKKNTSEETKVTPTEEVSITPTGEVSVAPTAEPTEEPAATPTAEPTPTSTPTPTPTETPTKAKAPIPEGLESVFTGTYSIEDSPLLDCWQGFKSNFGAQEWLYFNSDYRGFDLEIKGYAETTPFTYYIDNTVYGDTVLILFTSPYTRYYILNEDAELEYSGTYGTGDDSLPDEERRETQMKRYETALQDYSFEGFFCIRNGYLYIHGISNESYIYRSAESIAAREDVLEPYGCWMSRNGFYIFNQDGTGIRNNGKRNETFTYKWEREDADDYGDIRVTLQSRDTEEVLELEYYSNILYQDDGLYAWYKK